VTPAEFIATQLEGENPSERPPADPPWSEIAELLQTTPRPNRMRQFNHWVAQANGDGELVLNALVELQAQTQNSQVQRFGRLWSIHELFAENFGDLPVLVGEQSNAIIVRREGHLIVGPPASGKTLLSFDISLKLASGANFFEYCTISPLTVFILQAELPLQFVQARFLRLVGGYQREGHSNIINPAT
jgi:hypothetical protein